MRRILFFTLISMFPMFLQAQITWNGSTSDDWQTSANWTPNTVPGSSDNVIIANAGIQPVVNDVLTAVCNNLIINSGAVLTIASKGMMTVSGDLTNNAGTTGIVIKSDALGSGSLIQSTAGVNGTVEMFLSGTQWHYVSSPIADVNYTEFSTLNFDSWDATKAWAGGTNTDPWSAFSSTLVAGVGYANYDPENTTVLSGVMNTGPVNVNVFNTSSGTAQNDGWNLIGNPYTCAIDWALVDTTSSNLNKAIYFYDGTQYAYWNGASVNGGSQYIPQGQGFFVQCNQPTGGTLTFKNDDRVHNAQNYWKGSASTSGTIKIVAQGNGLKDETLIRFISGATDEFDGEYDAYKLLSSNPDVPQLYSLNYSKTTTFAINSLPEVTNEIIIPLGFLVTTQGTYSISPSEMNTDAESVFLEDTEESAVIDLRKYPTYIFDYQGSSTANEDRFILRIIPNTTAIETVANNDFRIYPNPSKGFVNFNTNNKENKSLSVEVFNIKGQKISEQNFDSLESNRKLDLRIFPDGIYTLKIKFDGKIDFQKLILMK